MRSLVPTLVVLTACAKLGGLGYEPDARARDTGEVLPELLCAPRASIPDAFGCECSDACMSSVCATEEELLEKGFGSPQGQCVRPCLDDAGCGAGYMCVIDTSGIGMCMIRCEQVEDCPFANTCGPPFVGVMDRVCRPLCQADSDCRGGRCDRWTGSCGREIDPSLGDVGDPCTVPEDCRSAACYGEAFCTADCSISRQGCPEGAICIDDSVRDDDGFCVLACTRDADCAGVPGMRCRPWKEVGNRRGCFYF
jgi:hypothetical protein